jgi:hypothetical protein
MKEVRNTNFIIQKFNKHKLAEYINFEENKLKIISPQPPIGNWLYILVLIISPLLIMIWKIYQSGFEYYPLEHLILPGISLIVFFYLNRGNNNFIIDFNENKILIYKKPLLEKIIYLKPRVILFDQIGNIKIEESPKSRRTSYGKEPQYNFKVFLLRKDGIKKILLIEFTNVETKVNRGLATILADFLKLNIFHRLTGSNPKGT